MALILLFFLLGCTHLPDPACVPDYYIHEKSGLIVNRWTGQLVWPKSLDMIIQSRFPAYKRDYSPRIDIWYGKYGKIDHYSIDFKIGGIDYVFVFTQANYYDHILTKELLGCSFLIDWGT